MTHEFKHIIDAYAQSVLLGQKAVLATLVDVEGSSYRKEGVRMLVLENNQIVGAVSGGCVEKEVVSQSQTVFKTGVPKMMTYDGRFRLGCEGTLYLLLEKLQISKKVLEQIQDYLFYRKSFELYSYYDKNSSINMGTIIKFKNSEEFILSRDIVDKQESLCYSQEMKPCFQLYILGTEHDAEDLCLLASNVGWEVTIVATIQSKKRIENFKGAKSFLNLESEQVNELIIDDETAVVLMTHNYAKDFSYLRALKNTDPIYIGLLGAVKRKEQLLSAIIEEDFEVKEQFLDKISGPAGLNIGAETPQEIAISILAEIIAVVKEKENIYLKNHKILKNLI